MVLYGLIVKSSEQRSDSPGKPIMTREGDELWVTIESEGWVPATSQRMTDRNKVPYDLKVWNLREEAEEFGRTWKGHPWWCSPISYEVIEVEPKFKQTFDGYTLRR